eukprot:GHVP01056485.1.p1 GENE.GHVP01056485.1~~GHVP01056485.1.p1  ORF type:complete len:1501 (-),score=261.87 GHVP01056485.1:89-4591(-)
MVRAGVLLLEDKRYFTGKFFGDEKETSGELVFNTGMVGYPECLTDKSYKKQILNMTYPLIGNYGVPSLTFDKSTGIPAIFESSKIQVAALIVADYSEEFSHFTAERTLGSWLKSEGVCGLTGIDTRAVTKHVREFGSIPAAICFLDNIPRPIENYQVSSTLFEDPNCLNLVSLVSVAEPYVIECKLGASFDKENEILRNRKILVVDCGIKANILRCLVSFARGPTTIKVVPWNYNFSSEECDGLVISNGPGDPQTVLETIENLKKFMRRSIPILGICLGHQLLALASGGKTYKMRFGNRSMNQPVIDLRTSRCYMSSQNHGYAVDTESLSSSWIPLFVNANDRSNEGIIHRTKPWMAVQFHPEACPGPSDTSFIFSDFYQTIFSPTVNPILTVPMNFPVTIQKLLLLGSGGLSIGQAGEFDYSGSQALKALKENYIHVVLVNPNIATVQTSQGLADRVYFLPIEPHFVEKIIEKENPCAILCTFGGQTALNCAVKLHDSGVLKKFGVRVLGTPIENIKLTEDREEFAARMAKIGVACTPSESATNLDDAMEAARRTGYPVLLRIAYALGGLGSGICHNEENFRIAAKAAFTQTSKVYVDGALIGWKELEYEIVRDSKDNCVAVCNMENIDPLGIHTGDSIVVAPSQTLTNQEYFELRDVAIKIVRELEIVGECNVQFAMNPKSHEFRVIEVNARLSRSSALASKATGYPLAYVAAKLSLGLDLVQTRNAVNRLTTACFEPALDYIVTKVPVWDLRKFEKVDDVVNSSMKSVGEVMAIGRTFEESFQKALRMAGEKDGFEARSTDFSDTQLENLLSSPTSNRIQHIATALERNWDVKRLHALTKIDNWFLSKMSKIHQYRLQLRNLNTCNDLKAELFLEYKRLGFSDRQIATCISNPKEDEMEVRLCRRKLGISPLVKQIDSLAAEYPAVTNYLYNSYLGEEHDVVPLEIANNSRQRSKAEQRHLEQRVPVGRSILVLGCGPYRIGSSVEFDWTAMQAVRTLRDLGYRPIVVNCNPETVSTDFDECDRLYFEDISLETVLDIWENEKPYGVVVSLGGQKPNNLALQLAKAGVNVLGTPCQSIDCAEDRSKFSSLLDTLEVDQPKWEIVSSLESAMEFAESVGWNILVRPSYVLSGAWMQVITNAESLKKFLAEEATVSRDHPVVVSQFILNAKEVEFDGVADNGTIVNYAISEHVENAGLHSGDATLLLPAQNLYVQTIRQVKKVAQKIAKALKISGPFNIQYMSVNNKVMVIECNLRASRTFPFISKTLNINFIDIATRIMVGAHYQKGNVQLVDVEHTGVKAPIFSFSRLAGADPLLGVEMRSTGEVACFGTDLKEAVLKAVISTGFKIPKCGALVSVSDSWKEIGFGLVQILASLGLRTYATPGTFAFLKQRNVPKLVKVLKEKDDIRELLKGGEVDLVINLSSKNKHDVENDNSQNCQSEAGYLIRRCAIDFGVSLVTNPKLATLLLECLREHKNCVELGKDFWEVKSWEEYVLDMH